ncbi:50S ribosomal protein L15 [Lignipirellula cremea]|uniref:Large ribosomal subunit protein uL15 n=1 Tax=Lignipirellula cremea TaxID=2528010 RepID=A0A518DMZ1_9BACT|nr:50S ribosomal protein L15 [Lignipirellula cremea]QDU93192.1 50S ribosomal protein L15 [Lignipirellula cremea]
MNIEEVHRGVQTNKHRRRIGRGPGSGSGKTAARGHKGAKSRAGYSRHPIFQGGAMPLVRRVPKRGFNNKWALNVATVNVSDLERAFEAGSEVNSDTLRSLSVLKGSYDELKILGDGELTKKLKVTANRFSASAKEKIEKAGGEAIVIRSIKPVAEKRAEAKAAKKAAEGKK